MNDQMIYDQFSEDYDRFVNWKERLPYEIPFVITELSALKNGASQQTSILDAACGTGHHMIALKEHGFNVAGADISAKMVEIAWRNARAANLDLELKQTGFGKLANTFGSQVFDGLICLGNSLPHVLDESSMLKSLIDFRAVMRPGGKLIIQNRNFDGVLQTQNRWMDPQTYHEDGKTWIFARFYDFDPDGLITFNIMILFDQGTHEIQQRVISTRLWPIKKTQLEKLLVNAGFNNIRAFGDLQGSDFDKQKSGNLVVTATAT
jgi:glycine/sarcosine N-methyltransferase